MTEAPAAIVSGVAGGVIVKPGSVPMPSVTLETCRSVEPMFLSAIVCVPSEPRFTVPKLTDDGSAPIAGPGGWPRTVTL